VALAAAMCWGLGSVYALHAPRPKQALLASAIEMLSAGAVLAVLAAAIIAAGVALIVLSGSPSRNGGPGSPPTGWGNAPKTRTGRTSSAGADDVLHRRQ
jgi:hypothetical protein